MSLGAWLSFAGFKGIYRDFECMYAGESNAWQTFSGVVAAMRVAVFAFGAWSALGPWDITVYYIYYGV